MGAQSKAHGAANAVRLGETGKAANLLLGTYGLVPEWLFLQRPYTALHSVAGDRARTSPVRCKCSTSRTLCPWFVLAGRSFAVSRRIPFRGVVRS
jgi:hypothetical protein